MRAWGFYRRNLARPLAIAAVLALHGLAILVLRVPQYGREQATAERQPSFAITLIPALPLAAPPDQRPLGSSPVLLAVPQPRFIPPQLPLFSEPTDPGLAALGPYVRCALPEHLWRDERERCAKMRAEIKGKDAPRRQRESDRVMVAQIDREMARRNAPTAMPRFGLSPSGLPRNSAPAWNDEHFNW